MAAWTSSSNCWRPLTTTTATARPCARGSAGAGGLVGSWNLVTRSQLYGESFAIGDLNRDGWPDVVTSEWTRVGVALGGAAGYSSQTHTDLLDGTYSGAVAVGDLNGDGRLDVALASGDVLFNDGQGGLTSPGGFDYPWGELLIADLDSDGLADILSASGTGVTVLRNTRRTQNRPPSVETGPDLTFAFLDLQADDCGRGRTVPATASDPDAHRLTYEWRGDDGALIEWPYRSSRSAAPPRGLTSIP